jgi:hypothetical protein
MKELLLPEYPILSILFIQGGQVQQQQKSYGTQMAIITEIEQWSKKATHSETIK